MQTNDFIAQVQLRAQLPTPEEATRAIQATLQTLAERIGSREATDVAAQLPAEIRRYLLNASTPDGERFSADEFMERVKQEEGASLPDSIQHTRAVLGVLKDAVSSGELADVMARLPDDYQPLFGNP